MRVRVRFRYRAETGEVELFDVDDIPDGVPLADHDARHDRAAADVARVVEPHALIEEVEPVAERHTDTLTGRPGAVTRDQADQVDRQAAARPARHTND